MKKLLICLILILGAYVVQAQWDEGPSIIYQDNTGAIKSVLINGTNMYSSGQKCYWNATSGSFRAGSVNAGNLWDLANQGTNSAAFNRNNKASGNSSFAIGEGTTASGNRSFSSGWNNVSSGDASFVTGSFSTASGPYSVSLGAVNTSSGNTSIAIGGRLTASATNAVAIGSGASSSNLTNNIANSIMIGGNSNLPTLYIGPSAGVGTRGRVGVGTSAPSAKLHVNATEPNEDGFRVQIAGSTKLLVHRNGNVAVGGFIVTPTSSLHVIGDAAVTGQIVHPSDKNLKENITAITHGLSMINQLSPKTYTHKSDMAAEFGLSTKPQFGLIAQEVEKVLPEIVIQKALQGEDGQIYMGLDYEKLIPILIAALQEADAKIQKQQAENDDLKAMIDHNTNQINEILSGGNALKASK